MQILIIDGQGGKMGRFLVEGVKKNFPEHTVIAVGTNSIATAAMLKAGADHAATGENPVIFNSRHADLIVGPIGIIVANALWGEISPAMAQAVGESRAEKILLPVSKCSVAIAGMKEMTMNESIESALQLIAEFIKEQEG